MQSSTTALVIVAVTMFCFVTEIIPLPVTSVAACLAMSLTGVISYSAAFSGFSNDTLFMVVGAMIMGDTLFVTGAAQDLGRAIIRLIGTNEKRFLVVCILITGFLSAFLSNTAVVAMMLPIVGSIAGSSGGKIKRKNCIMGIGYAAVAGGACTLVGSTPQLVGQGILLEYGLDGMGFFDLTLSGVLRMAVITLYFATFGYRRMKQYLTFEEPDADIRTAEGIESRSDSPAKKALSVGIIVFAVVGFVTQIWTVGTVAMIGGLLCILTRCVTVKEVFRRLDWVTVVVLGGSFGFAGGISSSGAGLVIADGIIGLVGRDVAPWLLYGAIAFVCILLGNIMSHTATAASMCPIVILLAQELGLDPVSMVLCVVISVCAAYVNPAATPPLTMTLTAGYRFRDFILVGYPLQIIVTLLTILALPLLIQL